ncbi:hypothetical protein [Arthrobacter sp. Z1-9]
MKTTKRLFWTLATTLGIAAATAGPALAGVAVNHTEPLNRS